MRFNKVNVAITLILIISLIFVGCKNDTPKDTSSRDSKSNGTSNEEQVVLKYWTWYPNADQLAEAVSKFEEKNPNIKIDLNIMESKAYQEKLPVALATNEDIDLAGVQPTAMAGQIKTYLEPLDALMKQYIGEEWAKKYQPADLEACKSLTDNELYMLSMVRCGAMIGYYNVEMLKKYDLQVPTTIDEFKVFAEKLKEKDPSILPASFAAKDAWVCDEIMLTVMGQTSDYYNQWRYNGASIDSREYIQAMNNFKRYFDEGIFSRDLLDLDYGRAYEMFTSGKAATFFQGTWEGSLLSQSVRENKQIDLKDVGCFALPVVEEGGKLSLRSYLDAGIAVVKTSEHKEEATKFLNYLVMGEGADYLTKHFVGTPGKIGFNVDDELLQSDAAVTGFNLMTKLVQQPTADRNNVSGFSDVVGASLQRIVLNESTAEEEAKKLQIEWESGKY